jgi:hypothetical protein
MTSFEIRNVSLAGVMNSITNGVKVLPFFYSSSFVLDQDDARDSGIGIRIVKSKIKNQKSKIQNPDHRSSALRLLTFGPKGPSVLKDLRPRTQNSELRTQNPVPIPTNLKLSSIIFPHSKPYQTKEVKSKRREWIHRSFIGI